MARILDTARNRGPAVEENTLPVEAMPLGLDIVGRRTAIGEQQMGLDRLAKVRAQLAELDYAAALLSDPINIRYATGSRNMAVWTLHAPGRYVFVPVEGPVVLFEYGTPSQMEAQGVFELATVDEVRPAIAWFYFSSGPRTQEKAQQWATEIISLMRHHGAANRRLAVDRCEPCAAAHRRRDPAVRRPGADGVGPHRQDTRGAEVPAAIGGCLRHRHRPHAPSTATGNHREPDVPAAPHGGDSDRLGAGRAPR